MWVYIWEPISDMQWPAPSGFHVPSSAEWVALCWILTTTFSMARNATTMGTYLKMPVAWLRSYNVGDANNVGSYGYYWSSSPYTNDNSRGLFFSSYTIRASDSIIISIAAFIRCFKDSSVIPTSSWTKLYDWSSVATGAWVFHNAADWLISISGDWQTWYTIQDKNLWATTVFNQWDTLTDANCGNVFQRWNNYAFPWTLSSDSITTSSTQVDASTYWPWNYYSSSTYITRLSSPHNWSSVQNDNLWWWVTQWTTTKSTDLKNAYIGEYRVPWANTIAYYPLDWSLNDSSGNGNNWTVNWTITYDTVGTMQVANFWGSWYVTIPGLWTLTWSLTVNLWMKSTQASAHEIVLVALLPNTDNKNLSFAVDYGKATMFRWNGSTSQSCQSNTIVNDWVWHNIVTTINGNTQTVYVDWISKWTLSCNYDIVSGIYSWFWVNIKWSTGTKYNWLLSNIIVENMPRTAQEITDYYNLTKSNYGL